MTAIAYDPKTKTVACDSLAVQEGRKSYVKKYKVLPDGRIVFVCGAFRWLRVAADAVRRGLDLTQRMLDEASVVVFDPKRGTCFAYDDDIKPRRVTQHETWGTGSDFAIAALDAGATVEQAVKIACKRSDSCGGKVHVFTTEK